MGNLHASVTCHPTEVRIPPLSSEEAGTRFSDPGGMQGWVDLCYVKAYRPGLNSQPVNRKSNALPQIHHACPYVRGFKVALSEYARAMTQRYHVLPRSRFGPTHPFILGNSTVSQPPVPPASVILPNDRFGKARTRSARRARHAVCTNIPTAGRAALRIRLRWTMTQLIRTLENIPALHLWHGHLQQSFTLFSFNNVHHYFFQLENVHASWKQVGSVQPNFQFNIQITVGLIEWKLC